MDEKQKELQAWMESYQQWVNSAQQVSAEWMQHTKQGDCKAAVATWLGLANHWQAACVKTVAQPDQFMASQQQWWQQCAELCQQFQAEWLASEQAECMANGQAEDKRFRHEDWYKHPFFKFLKENYQLSSQYLSHWIENLQGLETQQHRQLRFFVRQLLDALAPSNFIFSNPELLRLTLESKGKNLSAGLENLLADLRRNQGVFGIKMTDYAAFQVGHNVACTPGEVIYRNPLFELIQYHPSTETVFTTPLLIIPPCINKYYILDLSEKNSFVRWLVAQGHTVLMLSWVNPTASLAESSFADYVEQGVLAAIENSCRLLKSSTVNTIGFCVGGTLLATALALLQSQGKKLVKSATFLATLLDFSNPGDLGAFISEQYIQQIEEDMAASGYMDGRKMALIFNMLRDNDLIWPYFTDNYLAGKQPLPFDLLYWNSDATHLPAAMHSFYLRQCYLLNNLIKPGGITVGGLPIDLSAIDIPNYFISTQLDHIAPWQATYEGAKLLSGATRFVLGGSGHIAGIVNPPQKEKYGYAISHGPLVANWQDWLQSVEQQTGSWWLDWQQWVQPMCAGTRAARIIAPESSLGAAPGEYVKKSIFNSTQQ